MELPTRLHNTKDAKSEAMLDFFREQNVQFLPHVQVFVGGDMVDEVTVPPAKISALAQALDAAAERLRERRVSRERRRLLLETRRLRRRRARLSSTASDELALCKVSAAMARLRRRAHLFRLLVIRAPEHQRFGNELQHFGT